MIKRLCLLASLTVLIPGSFGHGAGTDSRTGDHRIDLFCYIDNVTISLRLYCYFFCLNHLHSTPLSLNSDHVRSNHSVTLTDRDSLVKQRRDKII